MNVMFFSRFAYPLKLKIEIILSIGLVILSITTIGVFKSYNLLRKVILILLWVDWFILASLRPAKAGNYDFVLIIPGLALGGLFAVALLIERIIHWVKESPASLLSRILLALVGSIAFALPYILWTVNAIPSYETSMYIAITGSILSMVISFIILHKKQS